jgi:N-hydroxyarylamine O-acetyltransferase
MKIGNAKLRQYFERIDYGGPATPSQATLQAVHAAHVFSVPFENIDVQLGRAVRIDIADAFQKIVVTRRGGWCYEQNGLFGWALTCIGFDVTRIAAAVMRQDVGDASRASHLCLLVKVPESGQVFLADVGFGGSMIEPIPLLVAEHCQAPFKLRLEETDDGFWRFSEAAGDNIFGYDFVVEPACEGRLAAKCNLLQSDPDSTFVLNLVAQRRLQDSHRTIRGKVLTTVTRSGTESLQLRSAQELVTTLRQEFQLDVPGVADLWSGIMARHRELFTG